MLPARPFGAAARRGGPALPQQIDPHRRILLVRPRGHRREPLRGVAGDLEPGLAVEDRIAPMSCLVTWPRRQISGISQRGSALRARPTFMRNQTASPSPRGRGPRARSARGSGSARLLDQLLGLGQLGPVEADQGGGDGLGAAPGEQRPGGGELVRRQLGRPAASSASSRSWSLARISSAEGGGGPGGAMLAAVSSCSARRRRV